MGAGNKAAVATKENAANPVFKKTPKGPLPKGTTLKSVIATLPKEVFEKDPVQAWLSVLKSTVCVAAGMWAISVAPWYLLPLAWVWTGTAVTGFFVIGHDCGHRAFSRSILVNDIVGTICLLPLFWPFESWRVDHNHHHKHTNKRDVDTKWSPLYKDDFDTWPGPMQSIAKLLRGYFWGISSVVYILQNAFVPAQIPVSKLKFWLSNGLSMVFGVVFFPWMVSTFGWSGLFNYWLMPWLGFHFWMSTFTIVHHLAPHIRWVREDEGWDAAMAQLCGSVHCEYPAWIDFLTHDISWHIPHHLNVQIPHYHLRKATASVREHWGDYINEAVWGWPLMKQIATTCHFWHEEENWEGFDGETLKSRLAKEKAQ